MRARPRGTGRRARPLAAQGVTIVVYMGVATAAALQAGLSSRLDAATPVAIVQHATLPNQRHAVCRLDALAATIAREQLASPAIIVIGDVVRAAAHLRERATLDHGDALRAA